MSKGWRARLAFLLIILPLTSLLTATTVSVILYLVRSERADSHMQTIVQTHGDDVNKLQSQLKAIQIEITDLYKRLNDIESNYVTKTQDNFHMEIIREDERTMTADLRQDEISNAKNIQHLMNQIIIREDKLNKLEVRIAELERVTYQDNRT